MFVAILSSGPTRLVFTSPDLIERDRVPISDPHQFAFASLCMRKTRGIDYSIVKSALGGFKLKGNS